MVYGWLLKNDHVYWWLMGRQAAKQPKHEALICILEDDAESVVRDKSFARHSFRNRTIFFSFWGGLRLPCCVRNFSPHTMLHPQVR